MTGNRSFRDIQKDSERVSVVSKQCLNSVWRQHKDLQVANVGHTLQPLRRWIEMATTTPKGTKATKNTEIERVAGRQAQNMEIDQRAKKKVPKGTPSYVDKRKTYLQLPTFNSFWMFCTLTYFCLEPFTFDLECLERSKLSNLLLPGAFTGSTLKSTFKTGEFEPAKNAQNRKTELDPFFPQTSRVLIVQVSGERLKTFTTFKNKFNFGRYYYYYCYYYHYM